MAQITLKAAEVHQQIETLAKEKAVKEIRHIKSMQVGKVVRQGDIYLHRVGDVHPHGTKARSRQLAVGITAGSRHVAVGEVTIYIGTAAPDWAKQALLGPCVAARKRFVVTHPEHAHVSLPKGRYQVTHQLDAQTMGRVQD